MALFGRNKEEKELARINKEIEVEEKEKTKKKVTKHLDEAKNHLDENEEILDYSYGLFESKILGQSSVRNGVLIATNKRILFYVKKMMGYETESIDYPKISSVEYNKGMVFGKLKIYTSNNEIEFESTMEHTNRRIMNIIKEKTQEDTTTSKETTSNKSSPVERLKELKELVDLEIISPEEFEEKKEEIMSEI